MNISPRSDAARRLPLGGVLRGERAAHGLRGGGRQPRQVAPRHRLRHSQVISDS